MAGEKKDKISNYGRKYKWFKIVRGDLALTLRSMKIKDNFFLSASTRWGIYQWCKPGILGKEISPSTPPSKNIRA